MNRHTDTSSPAHRFSARAARAASVLALCACFSACTSADRKPAGQHDKITIAFATLPETALAQVAQSQGYFREAGL
jgi:ABC-type nitrate/sulfonate/bicarbonate transport system substrate-binding protein